MTGASRGYTLTLPGLDWGAAVLAELLLAGFATIHDDKLVAALVAEPIDPLGAAVMRQLRAEPQELAVRDWLTFLASTALGGADMYEQVGRRMQLAGHVEAECKGLLRRSVRYVPRNINTAAWPWARLSGKLRSREPLDDFDTALGGLILATGLHRRVLVGDAGDVEARLRSNVAGAPREVSALLYHTETAVGATVITGA